LKVPLASVLIINWNGGNMLIEAVQSILKQTIIEQLEIIVVDNNSSDSSPDMIKQQFGTSVILIRSSRNLGFCGGNNLGIKHANGRYLLLINNDAIVIPRWAEELINAAESDNLVAMCTGKILCYHDRKIIDNAGHLMYADGLNRSRGHMQLDSGQYENMQETFFASGCAALYRRDKVMECGGFDEEFFAYGDDADLGMKLRFLGYKCQYVPGAIAYHRQSISTSVVPLQKIFWIERNRVWILLKFFPWCSIILSPFYTVHRYYRSLCAGISGKGVAGKLVREHPKFKLVTCILRAWLASIIGIPKIMIKRFHIQHNKRISKRQVRDLIKRFRATPDHMSFG